MTRNITLGLIGAVIGSTGLIWLGYATHNAMAQNPPSASTPPPTPSTPQGLSGPTMNFSGNPQGIFSQGDHNTNNLTINKDPRQWGFDQVQADKFRGALAASNGNLRG
jgi:hypothetical protein